MRDGRTRAAASVTASTGRTNPHQITTALPTVITHTPACDGARISAPARMAASQNSAATATIRAPGRGHRRRIIRSQICTDQQSGNRRRADGDRCFEGCRSCPALDAKRCGSGRAAAEDQHGSTPGGNRRDSRTFLQISPSSLWLRSWAFLTQSSRVGAAARKDTPRKVSPGPNGRKPAEMLAFRPPARGLQGVTFVTLPRARPQRKTISSISFFNIID